MKLYSICIFSTNNNGPWKEILDETLVDSRNHPNPLALQSFIFEAVTAGFVKFEVLSWYGIGGGLQYFNIEKSGDKISSFEKKDLLFFIHINPFAIIL